MVIALVVLSLAMIVGGVIAALQGWEIVVLERGWSLMISGTVTAASGAILLGVTAAVSRLDALRKEMAHLRLSLGRAEFSPAVPPPPVLASQDDVSSGLLAGAGMQDGASGEGRQPPILPDFMRPQDGREVEPAADDRRALRETSESNDEPAQERNERPRLRLPGNLFRPRREEEPARTEPPSLAERDVEPPAEDEPLAGRDAEVAAGPPAGDAPEEPGAPPKPATVVGSYNAGDNRYVMYSDGSIRAETPNGVFQFGSLDELKRFIAAGGDKVPTEP